MANELQDAVEAIQQQATLQRGIVMVADVLSKIGSLDQATKEAEDRRAAAISRLHETEAALEAANSKLGGVHAEANASLTAAQKQADDMVAEARAQADDIVKRGREDAQNLIDTARKDADAELAIQNSQLDALNTKIGDARKELELLHADTAEASAKLDETKAAIAAMKESAQKALG